MFLFFVFTLKVYDKSRSTEVSSDIVQLQFVPAFTVSETAVQLTASHRKRSVTVTGTRRQLDSLMVCGDHRRKTGLFYDDD